MSRNAEFETRMIALREQFDQGKLGISDYKRERNALITEYSNVDDDQGSQGNRGQSE